MNEYTRYRLELAAECVDVSKFLLDGGHFRDSVSCSYYAIFSAVRALLSERGVDFKKHSAVIGYFRREYIKTGIFDVRFSDYVGGVFEFRNDCDYEDFVFATRAEAELQYQHAVEFVTAVKTYLGGDDLPAVDNPGGEATC
ncbi:MAG: HEPN domain-containing protein [Selenomonadaceae bacterium]|nr:HEPN domain-containing protein [Selenomonadaceae bacterium]